MRTLSESDKFSSLQLEMLLASGTSDLLGNDQRAKTVYTCDVLQGHYTQVVACKDHVRSPKASFHDGSDGAITVESYCRGNCPSLMRIVGSRRIKVRGLIRLKKRGRVITEIWYCLGEWNEKSYPSTICSGG